MQDAVPAGVSAAWRPCSASSQVPLAEVCEKTSQGEVVACCNPQRAGPDRHRGHKTAVERAIVLAKKRAPSAMLLPMSVPSHCELMRPVRRRSVASALNAAAFARRRSR